MKNFKRPKGEKPYYYSSTIENGEVVYHDGDKKYAVYMSELRETTKRTNRWHKWVKKNYPNGYNSFGVISPDIMFTNADIYHKFMDGIIKK